MTGWIPWARHETWINRRRNVNGRTMTSNLIKPQSPWFNFVTDVFDHWALTQPEAIGLWQVNSSTAQEEKYTFAQLSRLSRQAADFFAQAGLKRGDRILVMLPRMSQWWIAMLGLVRLGAVPVPATLQLTARETSLRLTAAQIRAVLAHAEALSKFEGFGGLRFLVGGEQPGWMNFEAGLRQAHPEFQPEPTASHDPGMLFFTSATTGDPKMVLHTQSSYGLGHRVTGELWLNLSPGDVHWNISDLGWAKAAWSSFFGPWHRGACIFVLDAPGRFDPQLTWTTLARYPISHWCAPPTALRLLLRGDVSQCRFPSLRHCVTAGEPLNPEVLHRWQEATGLTLFEGYGQTETVVLVGNFRALGMPVRPGSMGRAVPGLHLAVLNESLEELPPGEEGELALSVKPERPPGLFQEYWLNPEETARRFQGSWYLTGDRVWRDADGYFWFVGRTDDVIKSSGYRIGPFEVESTLLEHPAVLEAGVVGKPDSLRGQVVKAFVVLRPGFEPLEELKRQLQLHCQQAAAPYKYPRDIEFVSELPKTISGKIRRLELRSRETTPSAFHEPSPG
jgi:acyl-coenzyme A synthetase/AMP-(fatty) acid ligase